MGSPFKRCDLRLYGDWIPELSDTDWQDLKAWSEDKRYLALVSWDTAGNIPGFRIHKVDTHLKKVRKSKLMEGCCKNISWDTKHNKFVCETFP